MSTFYKLQVADICRETPQSVSVSFLVPDALKEAYAFEAGQYITLKLTLDGQEIRRAYSICSDPNSGELRVAIKAISNGLFSNFANSSLQKGDFLEVGTPEGIFTLSPQANRQRNYAAFVAGSGITPVMSILKTVLKQEPQSTFVLVYGNKTPNDTIFFNELNELQSKYVGRFFVHYVFSQATEKNAFEGRINQNIVTFVLGQKHASLTFDKFYLCGPESMIEAVTSSLKSKHIPEKKIKFELFNSSSTEQKVDAALDGQTKVSLILDDDTTEFSMSQKQTLLEAALKQGLDVPYSCQGGICSSCLAKVTEGSATMKKNSILSDKEVADGLILTCQAHPTSTEITIDFDAV